MNNIKLFDKVILKNGCSAYIVEIFDDGKAFIADIDTPNGTETDYVFPKDILSIANK